MKQNKFNHYKNLLLKEEEGVLSTLRDIDGNGFKSNIQEGIGELSVYDNHPGDIGTETFQMELNYALEGHEKEELKNIKEALKKIEMDNYGLCEFCGKNILKERLEVVPAAKFCLDCAEKRIIPKNIDNDRPVEEEALFPPFGRTNTDLEDSVVYDGEDAWQDVQQHSTSSKVDDLYEDVGEVEEIEQISNEEYKKQLPD